MCVSVCLWTGLSSSPWRWQSLANQAKANKTSASLTIWDQIWCNIKANQCVTVLWLHQIQIHIHIPEVKTHRWHRPCCRVRANTQTLTNNRYFPKDPPFFFPNTLPQSSQCTCVCIHSQEKSGSYRNITSRKSSTEIGLGYNIKFINKLIKSVIWYVC